jgi:hypothetical protein
VYRNDLSLRIRRVIEKFGPQLDGITPLDFEKSRHVHENDWKRGEEVWREEKGKKRFDGLFDIDLGWESEDLDGGIGYE